ncbi:unnamed protein product [Orchesella dallaii]|uniref:Uncharacterized protein n=1 Tax=Orchesella dallaii TaxID=48710 RepID=A0ABP1Q779_9HEXA
MKSVGATGLYFLRFFAMYLFYIIVITVYTCESSELQLPSTHQINQSEENALNVLMNTQSNQSSYLSSLSLLNQDTTICDTVNSTAKNANRLISLLCSLHQFNNKKIQELESRSNLSNCTRLPPPPNIHSEAYPSSTSSLNNEEKDELNMIMSQGMSTQDTQTHSKKAILILGNTGSGKTTLTQLIAGNLSRLHGVLTSSNKLVIVDEDDRIGAPSIKSKTIYPEYVTNTLTNDSFYDCPGFDDNRGAGMDIAAMFSLKSITDSIQQAKFLFTVPHSSIRIGNDRLDFDLLTKHATRFLRNMSKMRESIGLIVTKVSSYSSFGNYVSDDEILAEVIEFLLKFRQTLHERINSSNKDQEKTEAERQLEFIETILKRESDTGPYERIWFVRNPPKCGPFSEIPYALQVRKNITNLYQTVLSFAPLNGSDFGITFKDKTLLQITQQYIPEIQTRIENGTKELVLSLKNEYFQELNKTLELEGSRREAILKVKNICGKLLEMGNNYDNKSLDFSHVITQIVSHFGGDVDVEKKDEADQIMKQKQLLSFFASLTNKSVDNSFFKLITTQVIQDMSLARERVWNRIQYEFVPELKLKVGEELSSLVIQLETKFLSKINKLMAQTNTNKTSTLATIYSQYQNLREVAKTTTTSSDDEVISKLYFTLGVNLDPHQMEILSKLEEMYSFYEQVTNVPMSREKESLTTAVSHLIAKINDVGHWYDFVIRVDSKLGKYSAQIKLRHLIETMLNGSVDDVSFLEEQQLIPPVPPFIRNISRDEDGRLSEVAKQQLHEVILSAINQKTKVTCENGGERAVIKGRFVKFSDFLWGDSTFPCCNGSLKELQIFASESVFIDKDMFARGRNLHVSIIAPKWEVVTQGGVKRLISLDGQHGGSFEDRPRAYSGSDYGNSGFDGSPGPSGGNGGAFFGVFDELVNGHLLKISVDGGDGGEGQDGGHGYSGRSGKDADSNDFPSPYLFGRRNDSTNDNDYQTHGLVFTIVYNHKWFKKVGNVGGRGGNGGSGGVGGAGGLPGFITLYSVNQHWNESEIENSRSIGHAGSIGEGGRGGTGGKNGNSYECALRSVILAFWFDSCHQIHNETRGDNGLNGTDGGNRIGQVIPNLPTPPTTEWKVITDYKHFVLETGSQIGMKFMRKVESLPDLTELQVKPISLAHELLNLERLYYKYNNTTKTIDFLQEYQQLLNRIQLFLTTKTLTPNSKKVLNFLCASILSKISIIHQKRTSSSVVINLEGFLSSISSDMAKLKEGQMREVISKRKQDLDAHFKEKQKQSESFITSMVLPSITKMSSEFEKLAEKVIQEINFHVEETVHDVNRRETERLQFESALIAQQYLQVISLAGNILSIFGLHHSYGDVGRLAHSVYLYYVKPEATAEPREASTLPEAFTPSRSAPLEFVENDKYFAQVNVSIPIQERLILELMRKYPIYLSGGDISARLVMLQKAFLHLKQMFSADYSSLVDIYEGRQKLDDAQAELISAFRRKQEEMTRRGDTESLHVAASIANAVPLMKLIEINPFLYLSLNSTQQQHRFAEMLNGAKQKLRNIESRKQSIYRVFLPILKDSLAAVQKKAGKVPKQSSSSTSLSATRWQVLGMLRSVRVELKGFVKGLEAEEQLILCLDKLEQSFSILIELYEHTEKYEEQKQLAHFIAEVNSPNPLTIGVSGGNDSEAAEMTSLLTKTDLLLQINLFQLDYEVAVNAFKQWVFPFAHNYLEQEQNYLKLNQTSETLEKLFDDEGNIDIIQVAEQYLSRIEGLKRATNKYKSMTVSGDEILIKSYFSSDTVSSVPFFVWRNGEWRHSISDLLSGNKVNLYAHVCSESKINSEIESGREMMGAIKFKTIELYLKHKNETEQQELDSLLENYHLIMTHSGISYYKILSDVVVMRGANQSLRYSFEKRCGSSRCGSSSITIINNNQRVSSNVVYDKFQGDLTDYLLSPYTMWTFQLIRSVGVRNSRNSNTSIFQPLEKFRYEVDLELRGDGLYVDEFIAGSAYLQQLDIGAFYQVDSSCFDEELKR